MQLRGDWLVVNHWLYYGFFMTKNGAFIVPQKGKRYKIPTVTTSTGSGSVVAIFLETDLLFTF